MEIFFSGAPLFTKKTRVFSSPLFKLQSSLFVGISSFLYMNNESSLSSVVSPFWVVERVRMEDVWEVLSLFELVTPLLPFRPQIFIVGNR